MPEQVIEPVDLAGLWLELRSEDGSRKWAARDQIFELFHPFARVLTAKLYANRTQTELEFMDFFQYASISLMEAIERFNPDLGVKFETFAGYRIKGGILNGIESLSEKQEQLSARKNIVADRVQSLQPVEKARISKESDAVFSQLAELAIGLAIGFVLEGSGMFQSEPPISEDTTYRSVALGQIKQRIEAIVETLPLNEKRIIKHHYWHQLSFTEISKLFKLTKGRISQIHKDALHKIQEKLRHEGIDLNF